MENLAIILILLAITAGITCYLLRQKKRGHSCTGCACACQCSGHCSSQRNSPDNLR